MNILKSSRGLLPPLITLFFLHVPAIVIPQTRFSLVPELSYATFHSYITDNSVDNSFRAYNRHFSPTYGLNFQLDIKHDWMVFAGWKTFTPVLGYKYGDSGPNLWWTTGKMSHRFPLGLQRTIGIHHWIKLDTGGHLLNFMGALFGKSVASERYLIVFRSRVIAGMSIDKLSSIPGNTISQNGGNISAFLGIGIQFFNANRDHLQMNFIYSMGISKVSESEVIYFKNGVSYSGILNSRGSYAAIQFSYPINLYSTR